MIEGKIDVKKITKSKLYVGEKGTYLDFTLIETPNSEYGDYMVVEKTTKAERDAGTKGVILGNCKIIKPKVAQPSAQTTQNAPIVNPPVEDDLPF